MKAIHDYVDNDEFKKDIDSNYLHNNGFGVAPNHKVKLHLNRRDDAIYNKLLEKDTFTTAEEIGSDAANSSIYANYSFFYDCIKKLSEQQIVDVRAALDRLHIVDLDVENENPQEIFESLNSTGLDLTDVDLLRNYLLMSLDYETQVRFYDDYWFKIEENVGPENMVRFFIDYLIYVKKSDAVMLHGRRAHVNKNNLYSAFRDYYDSLASDKDRYQSIPEITEKVLRDMFDCSVTYKRLVFRDSSDMNSMDQMKRTIYSIVCLNEAISARPVLLYVMDKYLKGSVSKEQTQEMLDGCLSLVFRAKVSGRTGINGQFAGNMLQRLPESDLSNVVDDFWKALTCGNGKFGFPSDRAFVEALTCRPVFDVLRAKGTKYLLYVLEQHAPNAKGLPRFDDVNTTIEHVMPKTLSQEWQAELGEDAAYHDDFLHKLGNLALTSNNPEMSNKTFDEKAKWYGDSSFCLTRSLADLAQNNVSWNLAQIRKRGRELAKKCVDIWTLPDQYQLKAAPESEDDQKRRSNFRFSMIGLLPGDEVNFIDNPSITAVVHDDTHVEFNGEVYSLSKLAANLLGHDYSVQGPLFFMYDGETLANLREEADANMF